MERIRLQKVALTVVDKFAHVKADEEALILSDTSIDQSLPEAMWGAADALGAKSHMLIMSSAGEFWKPPPKIVQQACFARMFSFGLSDVMIGDTLRSQTSSISILVRRY